MDIADRMKGNYEDRQRPMLARRTPVIIRIDGRAFHTYTRKLERPFSEPLRMTMMTAAWRAAREMQGCTAVYLQSDEASFLLTDYQELTTEAWFDYNQQKLCSAASSIFTAVFNRKAAKWHPEVGLPTEALAFFDARAFNLPKEEVVNYFLWRMKDWERNSVMMLARAHYSHTELHHKNTAQAHEMLHKKGINWADLDPWKKNGTWILGNGMGWRTDTKVQPTYEAINTILAERINPPSKQVAFEEHLEKASQEVATWPEWKQNICCRYHGCKYRDLACTVTNNIAPQSGPCEECGLELEGMYGDVQQWRASQRWPDDFRANNTPPHLRKDSND